MMSVPVPKFPFHPSIGQRCLEEVVNDWEYIVLYHEGALQSRPKRGEGVVEDSSSALY